VASLYVHVPFRERPRPYDDAFCVCPDAASASTSDYVAAVCRELRFYAHQCADDAIRTVYAGGGRPSLLRLSEVQTIVSTILDVFDTSAITEATAEVNPADATREFLRGLHTLGFNRLTLPVLSFYPDDLAALDAPHSSADAIRAIRLARQTGFDHLSVDLLFGRPEGSFKRWKANLQQAADLRIPHLAVAEWAGAGPGADAAVRSNGTDERQEVEAAKCLSYAISFLERNGYEQYELTHFARDGHCSKHHQATYAHANQLGVGPSAHTLWWSHDTDEAPARRWANVRDLDRYVDLLGRSYPPVAYRQTLPWTALAQEYVMLRLRTGDGLDLGRLRSTYGLDLQERRGDLLDTLIEKGLVERADAPVPAAESGTGSADEAGPRIRLTPRGRLVTDGIVRRLLAGFPS
jgi:oxygen-independent coproporphyrinogen-3 oxidase